MPSTRNLAMQFLETQWSSINDNKVLGIEAEVRFENHLKTDALRPLYQFIIPGGWIISPGSIAVTLEPTKNRIAVLPISSEFSWSGEIEAHSFSAQVLAHSYFQQAGIKVFYADCGTISPLDERNFVMPASGNYLRPYDLNFKEIGENGLNDVPVEDMMSQFSNRQGARGMRAYALNRLDRTSTIWQNNEIVTKLFWKEYVRYYLQREYLVSNNDLDFFIVSNSGRSFPVEFKSKTSAHDNQLGDWFGIDVGPYAKLAHFASLSNNMDSLYVVEEVDDGRNTVEWWAIKFSDLLAGCSWIQQGGGSGMGGGRSATIKVPKLLFSRLHELLPTL